MEIDRTSDCLNHPRRLTPSLAASFNFFTRAATASAASLAEDAFSIFATSDEPTTTASAIPPKTVTCAGTEIPKPTAMGRAVNLRTRRRLAGNSSGSESFAPVTPVREITYKNPVDTSAMRRKRSSVDVGAARKLRESHLQNR